MFKKVLAAGAVLACTTAVAPAATTGTSFNVTATVISSCSVAAPATLAFGNYDPAAVLDTFGTTTIAVTCSLLAPFNVGIAVGTNGVSVSNRKMLVTGGGTDKLNYSLSQDPTHLINWGNTVGTDTLAAAGLGLLSAVSLPVYGKIAAGQNVSVGSYTDTVTVTVTY